jgi:uncharacterized protein (TIGR02246 family)
MMLRKVTIPSVVAIAFLAVGCTGGTSPQAAAGAPPDLGPVNELRGKYQAAYNAGDAAALAALYTDDAISLPDHHPAVQGRPAIQKYFEDLFAEYSATMMISPGDTDVTPNLAHENGTFTIKVTPKAGGDTISDDGKYLVVLKRGADGAWKIHHDIDNSNRMPSGPSAAPRS